MRSVVVTGAGRETTVEFILMLSVIKAFMAIAMSKWDILFANATLAGVARTVITSCHDTHSFISKNYCS